MELGDRALYQRLKPDEVDIRINDSSGARECHSVGGRDVDCDGATHLRSEVEVVAAVELIELRAHRSVQKLHIIVAGRQLSSQAFPKRDVRRRAGGGIVTALKQR